MRTLRDLLSTWETWSERSVNHRALADARSEAQRDVMRRTLATGADVDPLDVLQDVTELVSLLSGWRWQVVRDAREAGARWRRSATRPAWTLRSRGRVRGSGRASRVGHHRAIGSTCDRAGSDHSGHRNSVVAVEARLRRHDLFTPPDVQPIPAYAASHPAREWTVRGRRSAHHHARREWAG